MDAKERARLLALVETVKRTASSSASGLNRSLADDQAYELARLALLRTAELGPVLPKFLAECHKLADFWAFIHTLFGPFSQPAQRLNWVRQQFLPVLDALDHDRLPTTQGTEGQQFFAPGAEHDGFVAIRALISTATKSLFLADNFVDTTLLPLLSNLPKGLSIRILTKNTPPDFALETQKFAKQYGVAVTTRITTALHDRFIVCDDQHCWHLGASVKDLGMRAALISEVTSQRISTAIRNALEAIWQASTPA